MRFGADGKNGWNLPQSGAAVFLFPVCSLEIAIQISHSVC